MLAFVFQTLAVRKPELDAGPSLAYGLRTPPVLFW